MRPVLHEYNLSSAVTAFSTTRHGGYSKGPYGELNINAYCGDRPEHIAANRRLLASELGVTESRVIVPHQVHQTCCRMVDESMLALPSDRQAAMLEGVDCVMTDIRQLCIGVSTADCIPVLLYDPAHHAAAAIHAGWRGTVERIVAKAVEAMSRHYDTRPEDLLAVIGPGISLKNFEVGQEVYDAFAHDGHPMELISKKINKWHIDLPLSNRLQLEQSGVGHQHIMMSEICTFDATEDYFSARRLGISSGRIYTGIILRS